MIAKVIVDIVNDSLDKIFEYIALPTTQVGHRVYVPFGVRVIQGYVLSLSETSEYDASKLKSIISQVDDYPILLPEFLTLNQKMCKAFYLRNVDCIRLFLPSELRTGRVKPLYINYVETAPDFNPDELLLLVRKNAKKQMDLIANLQSGMVYAQTELNKKYSKTNVDKLIELGALKCVTAPKLRAPMVMSKQDTHVVLNEQQSKVVNDVLDNREKVHLLFGVTGSGKTEVYMHIISKILQEGKTAILLVPEISLTPQVLATFTARFKNQVAILHSGLSSGERFDEWQRLRTGEAKIAIGARSAIFAPLQNIGVIILDEEHDGSYKAESNPRFLTHQVAIMRGEYNRCPVIFGSATPSLESYQKALNGEYMLNILPNRANTKPMPLVSVVNMCQEMRNGNSGIFSYELQRSITNCINAKQQVMLFLNRRGYSSYMICRDCGYIAKCEDCDVSLVYHKEDNLLKCHYCNKRYRALTNCPKCGSEYIRHGTMGTQKVVEELSKLYPNVKILRMDFDTTKNKNALNNLLSEFANTAPCVLVGTQMIAKGHDFPKVALVGIINADDSLHFSDFRAPERAYQLITQVAGRAGRANIDGRAILQTYTPNHYIYKFASNYDYLGFYKKEINLREVTNFPPFALLIRILLSSENKDKAVGETNRLFDLIKDYRATHSEDFVYCSAMSAPITKIENKFRYQILLRIKLNNKDEILDFVHDAIGQSNHQDVSIFVELNPNNLS